MTNIGLWNYWSQVKEGWKKRKKSIFTKAPVLVKHRSPIESVGFLLPNSTRVQLGFAWGKIQNYIAFELDTQVM